MVAEVAALRPAGTPVAARAERSAAVAARGCAVRQPVSTAPAASRRRFPKGLHPQQEILVDERVHIIRLDRQGPIFGRDPALDGASFAGGVSA